MARSIEQKRKAARERQKRRRALMTEIQKERTRALARQAKNRRNDKRKFEAKIVEHLIETNLLKLRDRIMEFVGRYVYMDLSESMKSLLNKSVSGDHNMGGSGYVTEKLYMLLQLYLQNKGWNPSVELLQCFSELKEASMLPSAAYLQMMAQRVTLDSQGRLVLRETGKIILPFEHFANAVMLKHMNGPQGLHLGLEATIRAVMDSYTIGREQFGMEKEFIIEVVQNCPNPACRYYKNQLEMSHRSMSHLNTPTYLPEPPAKKSKASASASSYSSSEYSSHQSDRHHAVDLTPSVPPAEKPPKPATTASSSSSHSSSTRAQLMSAVQQMVAAETKAAAMSKASKHHTDTSDHKMSDFLRGSIENLEGLGISSSNKDLLALHNGAWGSHETESKRHQLSNSEVGQEKIVRAFSEIMKNMARMKTCIRPAMCKPYGKQSESLQKTLMDTVQLVQSLRQVLPPPHIAVSSWKNEDKHGETSRKMDRMSDSGASSNSQSETSQMLPFPTRH